MAYRVGPAIPMSREQPATPRQFVPVHMGTPRFRSADHAGFQLTDAWFPPGLTLAPHEHERTVVAVTVEGQWDSVMQHRPVHQRRVDAAHRAGRSASRESFHQRDARPLIQPEAGRCSGLGQAERVLERAARFRVDGVAALARRIQWELRQPDAAAPLCLEGLSLEIVAVACRAGEPSRRANQPPPWLALAVEYLHDHCMERITVSDVAGALDVHPARLARTFRRHRGASIGSFVRDLRLQKAIGLLTGSTRSICDIAMSTGFADQSHLTRLCVRRTGRTPAEHRRSRD